MALEIENKMIETVEKKTEEPESPPIQDAQENPYVWKETEKPISAIDKPVSQSYLDTR